MLYVSEVSHVMESESFVYGGGHYRRSNVEKALVGQSLEESELAYVEKPSAEDIDYYFTLQYKGKVSDTVLMAFRTQIFVTRSQVAIVKGISKGKPEIIGLFDSQGREINKEERR